MQDAEDTLRSGLTALGIPADDALVAAFMRYMHELKRWGRAYNLTAIHDDTDIVTRHFLDSLLYLRALPEDTVSVADVGSGAGFPGLPMKLAAPALDMTLIEPSRKRCAFLRYVIATLSLADVRVVESRAEDVRDVRADAVVTRAFTSAAEFHSRARHLARAGGAMVMSKGPKIGEEVPELDRKGIAHMETDASLPRAGNITRHFLIMKA